MKSNKWKIKEVGIGEIEPTKVNSNKMTEKDFNRLVENIKKTGLSSIIACYKRKDDGQYVIISGNHRYKACLKLGWNKINILYADEDDLEKDEIVALQLSHNSLHGEDDKGILKRLFDEIQSIDYKEFAHISIDDINTEKLFSTSFVPLSEHYSVSLILYKHDMELIDELFEITDEAKKNSDLVILADGEKVEDKYIDIITEIKKKYEIKSKSIAFSKILELAKKALEMEEKEN